MTLISLCQILFPFSVLGMLFIFLRNLPTLLEFEPTPVPKEKKLYFRLKKRFLIIKRSLGEKLRQLREKNLHRLRVLTLKIDNFLAFYLKKTREKKSSQERNHLSKERKKKD